MSTQSHALFATLLVLPVLALPIPAQHQPAAPDNQIGRKAPPPTPPKSQELTIDGVLAMAAAGLSDDVIIAKLRKEDKAFDLTPDEMIRLKKGKLSDAVLKVMLEPKTVIKPAATEAPVSPPAPRPVPRSAPESQTPQPPSAQTPQPPSAQTSAPAPVSEHRQSTAPASRLRKIVDFTKQAAKDPPAGPAQAGPKAVDSAGLRNILPQFDPGKPLGEQFPHVALTILKAPAMWADTYLTSAGGRTGLFSGCFTVQAVVWSDAEHSKTVGPFDWCSPRDVQIQLGPMYMLSTKPPIKERFSGYLTGVDRTDGPRPPATLLPADGETQQLQMKNNPGRAAFDLNMENATRLTLMFANLRHGMGQTLADNGDFRVWIVKINR